MNARLVFVSLLVALPVFAQDPAWVRDWESVQRARPLNLSARCRIAPADEPGEPLVVHGKLLQPDGITPASGAIVFAYQTDARGLYHEAGKSGWRLRGWAVSDPDGTFEFVTIRPGLYPSRKVPAHIHFTIGGATVLRQWSDLHFADDALIPEDTRGNLENVCTVRRDGRVQHVDLRIRLKAKADF